MIGICFLLCGGGSVDEEDAVDVDAVAVDGSTEAEGVARAPARRDDAFPICKLPRFSIPEDDLPTLPHYSQRFHKARWKVIPANNLPVRLNNN